MSSTSSSGSTRVSHRSELGVRTRICSSGVAASLS